MFVALLDKLASLIWQIKLIILKHLLYLVNNFQSFILNRKINCIKILSVNEQSFFLFVFIPPSFAQHCTLSKGDVSINVSTFQMKKMLFQGFVFINIFLCLFVFLTRGAEGEGRGAVVYFCFAGQDSGGKETKVNALG